jgi:hypothetical protein
MNRRRREGERNEKRSWALEWCAIFGKRAGKQWSLALKEGCYEAGEPRFAAEGEEGKRSAHKSMPNVDYYRLDVRQG